MRLGRRLTGVVVIRKSFHPCPECCALLVGDLLKHDVAVQGFCCSISDPIQSAIRCWPAAAVAPELVACEQGAMMSERVLDDGSVFHDQCDIGVRVGQQTEIRCGIAVDHEDVRPRTDADLPESRRPVGIAVTGQAE